MLVPSPLMFWSRIRHLEKDAVEAIDVDRRLDVEAAQVEIDLHVDVDLVLDLVLDAVLDLVVDLVVELVLDRVLQLVLVGVLVLARVLVLRVLTYALMGLLLAYPSTEDRLEDALASARQGHDLIRTI